MSSQKKTLRKFYVDIPYKTWNNKMEMLQLVTSVPKKEQGIMVLLDSLKDNAKAEKVAVDLNARDLNTDSGVNALFSTLDVVFQDETVVEPS